MFLCLAALYESWSIPFAVMLIVPLGVLGALIAATGRGLSDDVYFQVGLLTTIGLSAKNAILIIQFALKQMREGVELVPATLEAVRLRLRPILMTSLAFGGGVLPLALATGAGSGSQNAIGTGVFGGMVAATFLGLLFVPLFFVVVTRLANRRAAAAARRPFLQPSDAGPLVARAVRPARKTRAVWTDNLRLNNAARLTQPRSAAHRRSASRRTAGSISRRMATIPKRAQRQ